MSTSLKITRENGGIKPAMVSRDGVSGILMYMPQRFLPVAQNSANGFTTDNRVIKIGTLEQAEGLGIVSDAQRTVQSTQEPNYYVRSLWYHLREVFRINPSVELWVGVFNMPGVKDFAEIKQMQAKANGEIRQMGVYLPGNPPVSEDGMIPETIEFEKQDVMQLQAVASVLENEDMPLSIVYCADIQNVAQMENCTGKSNRNVSILVGQEADENSYAYKLYKDWGKPVGSIGTAIGIISQASVQECIANVGKFDTQISVAGLIDGRKYSDLTISERESMEEKRLLFFKTYPGYSGVYFNDSYTQDVESSDYNSIERMRTMDKAARGVRVNLLPLVGANIKIDSESGKIDATDIKVMENEAQRYLEYMEKRGELSGYKAVIDSEQNILSTSELEVVIKQVPMGVMRKINVKMGFAQKV